MNDHSTTFEAVTSSMLKILKEDFSRTDSTLEGYAWKWNQLRQFMENNDLHSLTPKVCDDFLSSLYGSKDLTSLKSATKLFSVLLASKRPLITELADKLRLKYPLLPTISPCPTMRLEAIRSIIPISCRRYPKSV